MPVKFGVNPEETKAEKPVPTGWYKMRIKGLTIKLSKSQKGYNYVANLAICENQAEYNDKVIFFQMNNGFNQAKQVNDFCHAAGFPLEADGSFPGGDTAWAIKDASKPDEIDGAQYKGVLLGKTVEGELITDNYNGEDRNKVKQLRCKIQDCATKNPDIRHLTDLIGSKK